MKYAQEIEREQNPRKECSNFSPSLSCRCIGHNGIVTRTAYASNTKHSRHSLRFNGKTTQPSCWYIEEYEMHTVESWDSEVSSLLGIANHSTKVEAERERELFNVMQIFYTFLLCKYSYKNITIFYAKSMNETFLLLLLRLVSYCC